MENDESEIGLESAKIPRTQRECGQYNYVTCWLSSS
jgi:hypothetical protein